MATWLEDIVQAMTDLGGICRYADLYTRLREIRPNPLPRTFKNSVQSIIETHSSDSDKFDGGHDVFTAPFGVSSRKGIWALRRFEPTNENVDLTDDDLGFPEGKKALRKHLLSERSKLLVIKAKLNFKATHGKLFCEICEFSFEAKYGKDGTDVIEAHHLRPVSEMKHGEKTKIEDLLMVCSNCHTMLHRKRPWVSKDKLKSLLVKKAIEPAVPVKTS